MCRVFYVHFPPFVRFFWKLISFVFLPSFPAITITILITAVIKFPWRSLDSMYKKPHILRPSSVDHTFPGEGSEEEGIPLLSNAAYTFQEGLRALWCMNKFCFPNHLRAGSPRYLS